MNATKDNQDVIHRIDPENSEEISNRFDELVRLLEDGSDDDVKSHLEVFHHSDLADAFGLLPKNYRSRLLESFKEDLDPDLLFELEDHLRHEITDNLSVEEVAEVITEMDLMRRFRCSRIWMRRTGKRSSNQVPVEEREDIETGLAFPEDSAGRRMQTELVSVGKDWMWEKQSITFVRKRIYPRNPLMFLWSMLRLILSG